MTDSSVSRETIPPESTQRILNGNLAVEVARFGFPLALGMCLQTTFNLVDLYIIGQIEGELGTASVGAIGICDNLASLGTIMSYGLSIATGVILSRKQGEGDDSGVHRVAWQSILMLTAMAAVCGLFGVLGAEFFMYDVMGAKGQVAALGTDYLRVVMGGSGTMFLLLHLVTLQRALGSSKTPIAMLLIANVFNFVLAVLMVYGPGEAPEIFSWGPPIAEALGIPRMELVGAAWATVLARVFALVPTLVVVIWRYELFRKKHRSPINPGIMKQLWELGWPTSTQLVARIIAMLVAHAFVARAFTTETDQSASTALGVVLRLETMALFVGLGWGSASQTYMGQNMGAGQLDRAKASGWYAAGYDAVMMAGLAVIYVSYGPQIVSFFEDDPRVVGIAVEYLKWVAPSYVGLGVGIVLGSAIQGAGATFYSLVLDVSVVLAFQLPLCALVVFGLELEQYRLWQVVATTYVCSAVVYIFSYRRGTYLKTQLA